MNLRRRRNTFTMAATAALWFGLACSGTDVETPPNVLLIVADDLGWGDVGYHGGQIPTPNIEPATTAMPETGPMIRRPFPDSSVDA